MKSVRFLLIFLLSSWAVQAQELLTSITISTEQLQLDQQRGGGAVGGPDGQHDQRRANGEAQQSAIGALFGVWGVRLRHQAAS